MAIRLLLTMIIFSSPALAGPDEDPLPAGTRIRILNIQQPIVDMGGDPRAVASSNQDLSGSGISTRENSQSIVIDLSADVLFDFDRADLRPSSEASLQKLAQFMTKRAGREVLIEGYTDAKGSDSYNQRLSLARAEAVHRWLTQRPALSTLAFTVTGRGASNPVAPNATADGRDDPVGRQMNRRVEITIRK